MLTNTDHILTTHAGSLARPQALREAWARPTANGDDEKALLSLLRQSVLDTVDEQVRVGLDIPNDGEFGKPMRVATDLGAWGSYIFARLSGFGPASPGKAAPTRAIPGQPMRIVGERWEQRAFSDFYAEYMAGAPYTIARPSCVGPIKFTGHAEIKRDIDNLKAAVAASGVKEAFMTSIGVGSLEMFCRGQNEFYATEEEFLTAIADALAVEYRAIVEAGFVLQIDDPGLPDALDMLDPRPSTMNYQKYAELRVEALNHALKGIPADRVRFHICWGSWHGPHTNDLPLADIADVMLKVNAQAYSVEAGNVRHEHEYKVWLKKKLPDDKILIPGVVSHATNVVEHPELVADRILNYANAVGRERIIAGTDCGLGGRVHPEIQRAKLKVLIEGAELATQKLWGK